jgi:hypothetical protein
MLTRIKETIILICLLYNSRLLSMNVKVKMNEVTGEWRKLHNGGSS